MAIDLDQFEPWEPPTGVGDDFRFGIRLDPSGQKHLLKIVLEQRFNAILRRESDAYQLLARLGVPTIGLIQPYQESVGGLGYIVLPFYDSDTGDFLTNQDIPSLSHQVGVDAAKLLASFSGTPLPEDFTLIPCSRDIGWRTRSFEDFTREWEIRLTGLLASSNSHILNEMINPAVLADCLEEFQQVLVEDKKGVSTGCYVAHGNFQLRHLFLTKTGQLLLYDLEYLTTSPSRFLAQLADISEAFTSCWSNRGLQKSLIDTLLTKLDVKTVRSAMVLGVVAFSAHYFGKEPAERKQKHRTRLEKLFAALSESHDM